MDKIETTISIKYFSELFFQKKVCTYAASSAWDISTTFQPGRSLRWREITGANLRSVGFFHRETFPFLSSYSMGIDLNVTKCTNFKTEQCDSKMIHLNLELFYKGLCFEAKWGWCIYVYYIKWKGKQTILRGKIWAGCNWTTSITVRQEEYLLNFAVSGALHCLQKIGVWSLKPIILRGGNNCLPVKQNCITVSANLIPMIDYVPRIAILIQWFHVDILKTHSNHCPAKR